jgi:hypothetical protein
LTCSSASTVSAGPASATAPFSSTAARSATTSDSATFCSISKIVIPEFLSVTIAEILETGQTGTDAELAHLAAPAAARTVLPMIIFRAIS